MFEKHLAMPAAHASILPRLFLVAALSSCATHSAVETAPRTAPTGATRKLFAFRADFWMNLHEVLYHESLLPKPGFEGPKSLAHQSVASMSVLDADEAARWRRALAYYDAHFTTHNTFEPTLEEGTRFLCASRSEPALPPEGLVEEWRVLLSGAAPAYRAKFWPEHERIDRAYIEALGPQLAAHGEWMARRLEAVYQTPWPTEPVLVEVTPAVPPFGASTIGEPPFTGPHTPLIVVSSEDPGYRGDAGLEMIFHEASHLLVDKVEASLDESARRQGRTLPERFWHFLLFYTAGHLAQERLGPGYVPYGERPSNAIFSGKFAAYLPVLQRAWQPYLDRRVELAQAIDAVVAGCEPVGSAAR